MLIIIIIIIYISILFLIVDKIDIFLNNLKN
jgi:hypothetical protein